MQEGDLWLWLMVLAVLLWLVGWLVSTETVVVAAGDVKLRKMAEDDGNERARMLIKLTAEPIRFRLALETGRYMLWLAIGLVTGFWALPNLTKLISEVMSGWLAALLSFVLLFFATGFIALVFAYQLPKKLGESNPEKKALKRARATVVICRILYPFAKVCAKTVQGLAALSGNTQEEDDKQATEEEIRLLVDVGQEKGVIEESEKTMINNVFEFGDMIASEAMTHRTEIVAVEENSSLKEALQLAITEGYSRLPVYRDDLDTIVGLVYVKDLLKYVGDELPQDLTLEKVMRKPYFVPDSISCSDLLEELTRRHLQMAIVVDEYGGTAGLITMEDLMESIVGSIRDEYDLEEDDGIIVIDQNHYEVSGSLTLDELEELLDQQFPEGDYDTVGGLLLDRLERIPNPFEQPEVEIEKILFKVLKTENLRIQRVFIEVPQKNGDEKENR